MRFAIVVGLSLTLTGGVLAQHFGGHRTFGSRSGFGNVLFPGTGSPPPLRNPLMQSFTSFAHRLGTNVAGRGIVRPRGIYKGFAAWPYYGLPYVVPVYTAGFGYAGYAAPQPPQEIHVTVQGPAQPQPPVIINQYFGTSGGPEAASQAGSAESDSAGPGFHHYQAPVPSIKPPARAREAEPTVYLIAFKDRSIYPALSYWVEDDTLHYLTLEGAHNRASMDLIDVEFSERLNRERGLEFRLAIRP